MTGAYVRILRDNHWQSIPIEDLSVKELETYFEGLSKDHWIAWIKLLLKQIKNYNYGKTGKEG